MILKVLVGSRSHGLHTDDSDYDYRGVYVLPTRDILSLGYNYKGSHWLEGKEDQTSYEIGHFLHLATKCNPSILEVMIAKPDEQIYNWGSGLQSLFQYVWNPQDAFNAFVGYSLNQRKKMMDNHLERWEKFAVAYVRTLSNLYCLLTHKSFSLEVKNDGLKSFLIDIRERKRTPGMETVKKETVQWLKNNKVPYTSLRMRPENDYTPDDELKRQWLKDLNKDQILCVFDDRSKVVKMWRDEGLTCFQVAPGDF